MGLLEMAGLMLGSSVLSSAVTAWATLRGKQQDVLHVSEAKFRTDLLKRIEHLESHVRTIEAENFTLRMEIANLKAAQ